MTRLSHIGVALLLVSGCSVTTLDPAYLPARMTIVQRHSEYVPGSNDSVRMCVGDITGGQVLLWISGEKNEPIVDRVSVKAGDVIPFRLGTRQYYVGVHELRNFLAGDDFGVFEISLEPPTIELPPAQEEVQASAEEAERHSYPACERLGLPAERIAYLESVYSRADRQTLHDMLDFYRQFCDQYECAVEIIAEISKEQD